VVAIELSDVIDWEREPMLGQRLGDLLVENGSLLMAVGYDVVGQQGNTLYVLVHGDASMILQEADAATTGEPAYFTEERRPTAAEIRARIDGDGTLRITLGLPFGELACSSDDSTYDGLNNLVDELLAAADNTLSGISYRAAGVLPEGPEGLVLVEVEGDASDLFDDDEEEAADV
jgi:hypothetical protein